jgi:enoyl-CoA hydratase
MLAYSHLSQPLEEALRNETRRGMQVINLGETRAGANRFASGYGRHGCMNDI